VAVRTLDAFAHLQDAASARAVGPLRGSANDVAKEAYELTEINKSVSGRVSFGGQSWDVRMTRSVWQGVINGLSHSARDSFAAVGLGS
jgi:high affinity Mn2+ porin